LRYHCNMSEPKLDDASTPTYGDSGRKSDVPAESHGSYSNRRLLAQYTSVNF
jgi:hypothetical protein